MPRLMRFAVLSMAAATIFSFTAAGNVSAADLVFASVPTAPATRPIDAIAHIVDLHPDEFAGVEVDARRHLIDVYVAEHGDAATIASAVRQIEGSSSGWSIHMLQRRYSASELAATMRRITTTSPWAAAAAPLLARWYIDPDTNSVRVGLTQVTSDLTRLARSTFGNMVVLERAERPRAADTATRLLDVQPYWGGDRLVQETNCGPLGCDIIQCTGAFAVQDAGTGDHGMLTAGHCFAGGSTAEQGYFDSSSNTIFFTGDMGQVGRRVDGGGDSDGEFLDAAAVGSDTFPQVWTSMTDHALVVGEGANVAGVGACLDGSFTNENCNATVSGADQCINVQDDNGNVTMTCHQVQADSTNGSRLCQPGDSGGPVYFYAQAGEVDALGTITAVNGSGTTCWYSDLGYLTSALSVGLLVTGQAASRPVETTVSRTPVTARRTR